MPIRSRHVAITTSNQFITRFFKIFKRCPFDLATLRLQRRNVILINMDSIQIRYRCDLATSRYRIDAVKTNLTT